MYNFQHNMFLFPDNKALYNKPFIRPKLSKDFYINTICDLMVKCRTCNFHYVRNVFKLLISLERGKKKNNMHSSAL
jgi:hypothetical protein